MKIHFRPKTKKPKITKQPIFGIENENEYGSASGLMAWPDWPWPLRFDDIYATGQTDVFAKNNTALCVHCMPMHDKKNYTCRFQVWT